MIETGTVIHGTLRDEDLIPAFLEALRVAGVPTFLPALEWLRSRQNKAWIGGDWVVVDEYDSRLLQDRTELVEDLIQRLNHVSPPGLYFGAHPGDGSDFGWWPVEFLDLS
jgi:hypothetical protein